jgi:predicted ATPase
MQKKPKLVLLIGAPSTGKTSVINKLAELGYACFEEISRDIILEARKEGISHLFQKQPLLFSEKLLQKRKQQFFEASQSHSEFVFIDRGLPDITAYLDMAEIRYPITFTRANKKFKYDKVFWFPVWEKIYTIDNERYEDLNLALNIQEHLLKTYDALDYELIKMPKAGIEDRIEFLLHQLQ